MNAPVSIEPSLIAAHRTAVERVNSWRGRCVNQFARGERIVSEALIGHSGQSRLPMLLSQRVGCLAKAFDDKPRAAKAIAAFASLAELRNLIVHGEGHVFIDGKGCWLLQVHYLSRNGAVQRSVAENESEDLFRQVHQSVQRLESFVKISSRTTDRAGTPS